MHVADVSVLKMTSELPNQEGSFADGSHEEDQLAQMALLAEVASTADLPPEKPAPPVEVPVLPDSERNEHHLASEATDKPPPIPCTKCLICKECREISKNCLRGMIAITRNNTLLMEDSMQLRQEQKELNRRIQILQDWMMSPFRMIPLQVLQDTTLNINELHAVVAETPSDDNPWSVQLLELLDHSIAKHFPHFEFPLWEQEAPIPTPVETPKETPQTPPPKTPLSAAATEDFTGDPQSKHPDPDLEQFVSPSPEVVPDLPSLTSMGLEENVNEDLFAENNDLEQIEDLLREEFPDNPVLEVLDSPQKTEEVHTTPPEWQTVPTSEIENSSLPPMLEPKQTTRKPKAKREKRSMITPPNHDSDVQKKRRS